MDEAPAVSSPWEQEIARLRAENESLQAQLADSQETLRAIREGAVDALVIDTSEGQRVFTLQGGEHPYRALIEQMREGAATLTPEGVIHYCNQRFAQMLELPLERVMGSRMEQFVAPASRATLAAMLSEGTGRTELALRATDATEVPALVSAISLRAEGPAAICLVVSDLTENKRHAAEIHQLNEELEERVIQRTAQLGTANRELKAEIVERKRAEEALVSAKISTERAKSVAEQANQAKDHFLAVLSHELRTPLAPVLATVAMLQEDRRFDEEVQQHLEVILRNVALEARLIDDLLDVTRIAQGKVELDKQPVELCTIIRHAVEVCLPDIEAHALHFGVDIADGPYLVEADAARLQQVFWNLLKNAIKFTPVGGCVGIRCRREGHGHVVAEVNDSGVGITPEVLPGIFRPFDQGERSVTRQFGGLGLGLTISHAMVQMHGGSIVASSAGKDRGSTFRVRLPLHDGSARPDAPQARPRAAAARPSVRPLRILLVEDHGDTAKIMKLLLKRDGHKVETAVDVATALKLAGEQTFDLLVSDLGLPDGSGLDLMRSLRAGGSKLVGIALSGYGLEDDTRQSRDAGFAAHLTKPADYKQLVDVIGRLTI